MRPFFVSFNARDISLDLVIIMFTATPFIAPDSAAFRVLDVLADATNYLLLAWLLGILIVGTKRQIIGGKAWLAVALSIACVYMIKTLDSKLHIWDRLSLNYGTHTALAAATVLSLFFLDRPRRMAAVGCFLIYEVLQIVLGFHSLLDMITTLIVITPLILLGVKWGIAKPIAYAAID